MKTLITILFILSLSTPAMASLEQCVRACLDPLPTTPTTPTTPTGSKVFPDQIIFENQSDVATGAYAGKAVIMLPESWYGKILSVGLNGETGYKDAYKGSPVFRFTKEGSAYARPLKIVITASDGQVYTATTGSTPTTPTGKNSESVAPSSCGNPPGAGCRQNMRFSKPGSAYGASPKVYLDGSLKMTVVNSGKRQEGANGLIWKPVSDSNGKLVVVGEYGKKYRTCTIVW